MSEIVSSFGQKFFYLSCRMKCAYIFYSVFFVVVCHIQENKLLCPLGGGLSESISHSILNSANCTDKFTTRTSNILQCQDSSTDSNHSHVIWRGFTHLYILYMKYDLYLPETIASLLCFTV